jgi:hypothetical protein
MFWKTIRKPDGADRIAFGSSVIIKESSETYIIERLFGLMEVHIFGDIYQTKNLA